jgi:hypothetical protein
MNLFAATPDAAVVGTTAFFSSVFLLASIVICLKTRALENKLILLGLITAVAALLLSFFEVEGLNATVTLPGTNQRVVAAAGNAVSPYLVRMAVIPVLAGVTAALWTRCCPPASPTTFREEGRVP